MNKQIRKGFACQDGVFVTALDTTLASFNVEGQAYNGGTFISNHVHRCLKVIRKACVYYLCADSYLLPTDSQPEDTKKLCFAVVEVAQKNSAIDTLG